MALIRGLGYKGGNMPGLDSWRGLAKPFFYCGGQGCRIISVKNLLIARSSFLLPKNFSPIIWATKSALSPPRLFTKTLTIIPFSANLASNRLFTFPHFSLVSHYGRCWTGGLRLQLWDIFFRWCFGMFGIYKDVDFLINIMLSCLRNPASGHQPPGGGFRSHSHIIAAKE